MDREKIAAKIKALLTKTQESGCTEAEALAAAIKARQLMDEHDISMTEAEVVAEGYEMDGAKTTDKKLSFVRSLLNLAVADFTDTRIWSGKLRNEQETKFFGLKSDVIFARFLHDSLTDFVLRHADEFVKTETASTAKKLGIPLAMAEDDFAPQILRWWESFVLGATDRIRQRLKQVKQGPRVKASGGALVAIDKRTLITDELKRRGVVLGTANIKGQLTFDNKGGAAGRAAGDSASFNKPVNAGGKVHMLPNGRNSYNK